MLYIPIAMENPALATVSVECITESIIIWSLAII